MPKSLTPKSLAVVAKAKPIQSYERGQGFDLLRLGSRILYVSHTNSGPSYADNAEFVFSSLTMKDKLVLDDELVLKTTSVITVLVRGDTIWASCKQGDDEKQVVLVIAVSAAGKLRLKQTYPMPERGELADAGAIVAIKCWRDPEALELYMPGNELEKIATIPAWNPTGMRAATLHGSQLALLGSNRAGVCVFDVSTPNEPKQTALIRGQMTGPSHIEWYDDGYVVAFGGVGDIYRAGAKGALKRLGRIKTANSPSSMLRVEDVCFLYNGSLLFMKNPDKDSRKVELLQLGDKPTMLPIMSLGMPVKGMAVTDSHLHVLGDDRIATFAL